MQGSRLGQLETLDDPAASFIQSVIAKTQTVDHIGTEAFQFHRLRLDLFFTFLLVVF